MGGNKAPFLPAPTALFLLGLLALYTNNESANKGNNVLMEFV